VSLWSRVLQAVPGSRLLIAAAEKRRTRERLLQQFSMTGIGPERLDFRGRLPIGDYLALYHDVDIALDTFPYTGGTTTTHALWMGVPVLTLRGPLLQQQQAARILALCGLGEWAVDSPDAYVARATQSATHPDALAALRGELRERMRTTCVESRDALGAELEGALRMIWRRWCAGQAPQSLVVEA
jgi:predicted O-linked N-acetylglucosamine transferase (SPINDLY family)